MINHKTKEDSYDARKRDPQFAHASSSPLWELVSIVFLFSFVPSNTWFIFRHLSSTITTPQSRYMLVNFCLRNHSQPPQISLKTHFLTSSTGSYTRTLNKSKLGIQRAGKVLARCNRRRALSTVSS
jgi:hypothetical protein